MREEIVVTLKIVGPKQQWKSEDEIAENFKNSAYWKHWDFRQQLKITATFVSYKEID